MFKCLKCGIELNADYNGASNILKRALGYISKVRVALTQPLTRYKEQAPKTENLSASAVESIKEQYYN